ncbi:TRAP transporter small permease subunit [Sulfitobacter sp. 1A13191]|jgi:TRAP-type C4-dicarboxylate transport system permease small subunit|uniref:TRAP transporter small permease subunit n=1 Tax=unclassified Sulfitobacter TaxID=196795 RepID=UPI0037473AE5
MENRPDPIGELDAPDGAIHEAGLLGRGIDRLGVIFAFAILASAVILGIEVVLRYVFNAPTIWAHETVIFLNATAFVYGGLYVVSRDAHIRVVLIYDYLSRPWRRILDVVISLVCLVATAFFGWAAWQSLVRAVWTPSGAIRLESSGSAWDPPTPGLLKIFLFSILVIMAVQFAVLAWNYMTRRDQ